MAGEDEAQEIDALLEFVGFDEQGDIDKLNAEGLNDFEDFRHLTEEDLKALSNE